MITPAKNLLAELGYKPNEIKVYLALTELGESPASKVAKKIDLPRTTAISILDKLAADNLLSTHKYRGKTFYWIESPKVLKQILENKIKIADELDGILAALYHTEADFPAAQIYDSKSAIKKFIEKTLINLPKKTVLCTIDTPGAGNYEKIFSYDFGKTLINLKNDKSVCTKTLIPFNTAKLITEEKIKAQNILLRELPKDIKFSASLWLLPDEVVLFSGKYPFVVSVKHKIIKNSLQSIFDFLWTLSSSSTTRAR